MKGEAGGSNMTFGRTTISQSFFVINVKKSKGVKWTVDKKTLIQWKQVSKVGS